MKKAISLIIFIFFAFHVTADAAQVYFNNDDRIEGDIIEEKDNIIVLETEAMGNVTVDRNYVKSVVLDEDRVAQDEIEKKPKL